MIKKRLHGKYGMIKNKNFWNGKKVFITGHTGFKGSWLCLILLQLNSKIFGYSLKPKRKSLFNDLNLKNKIKYNFYSDIRNYSNLKKKIFKIRPDIIFHLAAQPLVLDSYKDPYETFETNTLGTLNLLEIVKKLNYPGAMIIVTTDKVYKIPKNKKKYLNENDEIGVTDPYGSSKVCSEVVSLSYNNSFFKNKKFNIAVARSGNVIGGGDYSQNRIIPDFYRYLKKKNSKLVIRNPNHIRPWQFVLDPLGGYLDLAKKKYMNRIKIKDNFAWNFGPSKKEKISVISLVKSLYLKNDIKTKIKVKKTNKKLKETAFLLLDSNKSKKHLGWTNIYNFKNTVKKITEWYEAPSNKKEEISINQVIEYINKKKL
jgi:CDP-glucose 4,6-dehydratase